ncbi:Uncharacterized protein BM_BM1073 [Brugia malayi]|uniref:Bm1073 n=1 Tax=Brugia malayi TaxID=6279 RepID=A0A0K0IPA5_BRUMA|nr:Uncharacterized protein BM_BM1073 [Brugia malayi]CDQ03129.1 Bm1073 [Brugia malayi]VIO89585.1 Uncharacterized protein BM_BM1073 [Brugia malayi]
MNYFKFKKKAIIDRMVGFQILFLLFLNLMLFCDGALLYSGIIEHNRQFKPYFARNDYLTINHDVKSELSPR